MSNKRDIMRAMWPVLGLIAGALLCLALSLLMSGCKTKYITQEVPVVVEHTTHEKSTELRVDTIYHRDSTIVLLKGDTLVERNYHTIYKVREVVRGDTIHDTVPQVVTVTKTEVKEVNRLHWWQSALMWLGGVAALLGGAWVLWRIKA